MAGGLALGLVIAFWLASAVAELLGTPSAIATAKSSVLYGLGLLIPAVALAGASGLKLSSGARTGVIGRKRQRMLLIAANGVLVLLPSAVFLHAKAAAGEFDAMFNAVQGLELAAGAMQATLLGLNLRDGLRLSRRLQPP
jgi:hypothetical protein